MESNLVRVLLLIALFFLLTSDYAFYLKQAMKIINKDNANAEEEDKPDESLAKSLIDDDEDLSVILKDDKSTEFKMTKETLLNAIQNSCLPKMICELNAAQNKDTLGPSEMNLLNLIKDTSISATGESSSRFHFAAHMGQLIKGIEGTGCYNFYPDCPLHGFKLHFTRSRRGASSKQ